MNKEIHCQPIPPVEAARWLVEFAMSDPGSLERNPHHSDWPRIRARVKAFVLNDYALWQDQTHATKHKPLSKLDILKVKERVYGGLKKLFSREGEWTLWQEQIDEGQSGILRSPSGAIRAFTREVSRSAFILRALTVLQAAGNRLRKCADTRCQRLFIAIRRQEYCTRACSDRVRLAKFRARHADHRARAKIQRRAAYERNIRRRLGTKVKVGVRG